MLQDLNDIFLPTQGKADDGHPNTNADPVVIIIVVVVTIIIVVVVVIPVVIVPCISGWVIASIKSAYL